MSSTQREWFHHPDFSFPVIRRRVAEQLVDTLACGVAAVLTRGRSMLYCREEGPPSAERSALCRLRKAGLVVRRLAKDGVPELCLTAAGERRLDIVNRPERRWRYRWPGRWYVLSYDVPERHRNYRKSLRTFLHRLRLGCLHDSVWITPFDIRPEFDDLWRGARLGAFAHLFESRTVLGLSPEALVHEAWDVENLERKHRWYLAQGSDALERVRAGKLSASACAALAREEGEVYRAIMADDPLLPESLWPANYHGPAVVGLHRELQTQLRLKRVLRSVSHNGSGRGHSVKQIQARSAGRLRALGGEKAG